MDVRLRPRFERFTTADLARVRDHLRNAIRDSGGALAGEVLDTHAQVMIGEGRRHGWSPYMTLSFVHVDDADGPRLRVRGLFGPHPALWTMIATLYGFCAFVAFVGLMIGWSQWIIDRPPWGLWLIPAAAVIALLLLVVSISGQGLAHDEMHELAALVDAAVATDDEPPPVG